jgi:hypothetical protein
MSALAAAVEDATGHRFKALPITPARVFAALSQEAESAANQTTALQGDA